MSLQLISCTEIDASLYQKYRYVISVSICRIIPYRPPRCRYF